jgi:hypothetical protein
VIDYCIYSVMYTPIDELPMPPAFMIAEAEEAERDYNTYLLQRIMTINEARPIRIALRQKLQTHPLITNVLNAKKRQLDVTEWEKGYTPTNGDKVKLLAWQASRYQKKRTKQNLYKTFLNNDLHKVKRGTRKGEIRLKDIKMFNDFQKQWNDDMNNRYKYFEDWKTHTFLLWGADEGFGEPTTEWSFAKMWEKYYSYNKARPQSEWCGLDITY